MVPDSKDQEVFFAVDGGELSFQMRWNELKGKRILFITGRRSFIQSGADRFLRSAIGVNFDFWFSGFDPNPSCDDLLRGLKYFHAVSPECIVAVGGGSVVDMAKLINLFGAARFSLSDVLEQNLVKKDVVVLPLIAIPTTAGSGSEATRFAVLYKEQKKFSVEHPSMLPSGVVLNPELTCSMSPYQTACCGFDAFSQAIESYWAVGATDVSRQYSSRALILCLQNLEGAVLNPTIKIREGMMEAAYLAGKAINIAKTTAAHALSYTLTAYYGLPHGHAVAMMLPWIFEINSTALDCDVNDPRGAQYVRDTIQELCALLGCDSPEAAIRKIQELIASIGLSNKWFLENGIDVSIVRGRVVQEVNLMRLGNNPYKLSRALLEKVAICIR